MSHVRKKRLSREEYFGVVIEALERGEVTLDELVKCLPEKQHKVFVARIIEGKRPREIIKKMGVSSASGAILFRNAVERLFRNAVERLAGYVMMKRIDKKTMPSTHEKYWGRYERRINGQKKATA